MKKYNKEVIVTIRLTKEQVEAIDKIAEKNYRDRSGEIRKAVAEYINQHKDFLNE